MTDDTKDAGGALEEWLALKDGKPRPIVRYFDYILPPVVGLPTFVKPINHKRVRRGCWARTSPVVAVGSGLVFWTRNTQYVPLMPT